MFLWKLHKTARDATCLRSCRNLSSGFGGPGGHDHLLVHGWRDWRRYVAGDVGLLGLVRQVAHCRGHPKDVSVTRQGGVTSGEVGDPPQSVAHGVWMNEQLAGAGLDRSAAVEVGIQGLGESGT